MALALLIIGALFLSAAIRGKQQLLFDTLKDDFAGSPNFFTWALALIILSALGKVKAIKPVSDAFLVLVVLILFISNRGFFNKFMAQVNA
jgi:hypothetical protein